MDKIAVYLKEKYGRWAWLGQRAHDAEGINRVIPLDFIISCDYGEEVPLFFDETDIFSIEKKDNHRKEWSNEHLKESLYGPLGRDIAKRWKHSPAPVNIICYRSIQRIENGSGCFGAKPRIFAVPEAMKKRFDNKVLLCRKLRGLSIPSIPCRVIQINRRDFSRLRKEFLLPFVVQFPYGSSGNGTFLIKSPEDMIALSGKYPGKTATVRSYIDGFSININAIIVSTQKGPRTFCCYPSAQIVGIPECGNSDTSFCGNDYGITGTLDRKIIRKVERNVRAIGKWMSAYGYKGIFGMDMVSDGEEVYVVEINPRFQNSTSLFTTLEAINKPYDNKLVLLHIAEFLQDNDKILAQYVMKYPFEDLMTPLNGSQIILHNGPYDTVIKGDITPGIYRISRNGLRFVSRSASLGDCRDKEEILVTCGVPGLMKKVDANAPLCKIQTLRTVLDPGTKRYLAEDMKKAVTAVYKNMIIKKAVKEKITV